MYFGYLRTHFAQPKVISRGTLSRRSAVDGTRPAACGGQKVNQGVSLVPWLHGKAKPRENLTLGYLKRRVALPEANLRDGLCWQRVARITGPAAWRGH